MPEPRSCATLRLMDHFRLVAKYDPRGDQPEAIEQLVRAIDAGEKHQTLLGVTGSGKTFTMANVIARVNRPTLIFSHNKTLAAQLYGEFRSFFPDNAVGYFVSYYDYYQPEAYVPSTDTYIEKDASINEEIDRLRLHATSILLSRRDVIIVASVSCIYGLGAPEDFLGQTLSLAAGEEIGRDEILRKLVAIQYSRNDVDFSRGKFRVRGDVLEVFPSHDEEAITDRALRGHGGAPLDDRSDDRARTRKDGEDLRLSRLPLRDPGAQVEARDRRHPARARRAASRAAGRRGSSSRRSG